MEVFEMINSCDCLHVCVLALRLLAAFFGATVQVSIANFSGRTFEDLSFYKYVVQRK